MVHISRYRITGSLERAQAVLVARTELVGSGTKYLDRSGYHLDRRWVLVQSASEVGWSAERRHLDSIPAGSLAGLDRKSGYPMGFREIPEIRVADA